MNEEELRALQEYAAKLGLFTPANVAPQPSAPPPMPPPAAPPPAPMTVLAVVPEDKSKHSLKRASDPLPWLVNRVLASGATGTDHAGFAPAGYPGLIPNEHLLTKQPPKVTR